MTSLGRGEGPKSVPPSGLAGQRLWSARPELWSARPELWSARPGDLIETTQRLLQRLTGQKLQGEGLRLRREPVSFSLSVEEDTDLLPFILDRPPGARHAPLSATEPERAARRR